MTSTCVMTKHCTLPEKELCWPVSQVYHTNRAIIAYSLRIFETVMPLLVSSALTLNARSQRSGGGIYALALLLGALMAVLGCMTLPWSPYVAWQQSAGTDMFHSRWIYERLHFDRAPIEVAFVGSSRFEAAISPVALQQGLSRRLGRKVAVANLSLVRPGRDLHAQIVDDLLRTHPEVRLIVLADDGDMASSHPMFAQVASPSAIVGAPLFINTSYFPHVLGLPYRALVNALGQGFPAWAGVARQFDPRAYAGTDLDRSQGYRLPSGQWRNGNITMDRDRLARDAAKVVALQQAGLIGKLTFLSDRSRFVVDRTYTERIAAEAASRNIAIAFVRLPVYGPIQLTGNERFTQGFGPDFALNGLADNPALFQDGLHMNHAGAMLVSEEIAERLAPLLCRQTGRPGRC